jgi:hypothetical protein
MFESPDEKWLVVLASICGVLAAIFFILLLYVLCCLLPKLKKKHQCSIDRELEDTAFNKGHACAATNDRHAIARQHPTPVPTKSLACNECYELKCTGQSNCS